MQSGVAEFLSNLKCCVPVVGNLIFSTVDTLTCPLTGVVDGLVDAGLSTLLAALNGLLSKATNMPASVTVTGFSLDPPELHVSLEKVEPCPETISEVTLALSAEGVEVNPEDAEWGQLTTSINSFGDLAGVIMNSVAQACNEALASFGDIFDLCSCPIVDAVVDVGEAVVDGVKKGLHWVGGAAKKITKIFSVFR
mmetsp:Transcript_51197/g.119422  ORF Transcript_51197/g.119422 Transcript_51197/m.119422 type:complete len:195 (+) Transcript_51197:3-587(+)